MNLPRPLAAWSVAANPAGGATRSDQTAGDMLRTRWLNAIGELGAAEDAAEVWTVRLGCSIDEGRAIVARAWRLLALPEAV